MEDRFRELVKSAADILKEVSVQKFLSEEQRLICDKLFFCKDRVDYEYGINAYIAGLYDAFRLIELFGMEEIKR